MIPPRFTLFSVFIITAAIEMRIVKKHRCCNYISAT